MHSLYIIFLFKLNNLSKSQEFEDYRDAEDAVAGLDGKSYEGQKLVVQQAGQKRTSTRNTSGPRGPQTADKCYNCGKSGHW